MLKKNEKMEYIKAEDGNLVVFDPVTQNTHILDEVGSDIVSQLDETSSMEELIDKLSALYNAPAEVIRADVTSFLEELKKQNVVMEP